MTNTAKKVAIAIIVILVLAIGWFLYRSYQPASSMVTTPITTNKPATSGMSVTSGGDNLINIIQNKLDNTEPVLELNGKAITVKYKLSDLKTVTIAATSSLRNYGLQVTQILKPLGVDRENEAKVMLSALDNKDSSKINKVADSQAMYQNIATNLAKLPAPKGVASIQLKIVNDAAMMALLLSNMSQVLNQPVLALQSSQQYMRIQPVFYTDLAALNKYLLDRGVKFSTQESLPITVNLAN